MRLTVKRIGLAGILIVFILLGGIALINLQSTKSGTPVTILETTVPPIPTLNPQSVAQGEIIYADYCANCHGANLEGMPNWKVSQPDGSLPPPPHNSSGHTWHHPDPILIEIITFGGDLPLYNTKMPGFGDRLSEDKIAAVLDYIKSYWGREEREYQWWLTARDEIP